MATIGLASANGFRCFVVVTSDNLWLGHQTHERFLDGLKGGPVVLKWTDWAEDQEGVIERAKAYATSAGVVFLSTKNVKHLEALAQILKAIRAFTLPGLIIDDEADNASLNTNESKGTEPSKVFEHIGRIRQQVPHHIYLQVTATPQSLLLQGIDHPCRPRFSELLPPGDGYVGGEVLFQPGNHYCQTVDATELHLLQGKVTTSKGDPIPAGLRKALCTFLVGTAYKQLAAPNDRYSFLAHVCYKKISHTNLKAVIRHFLLDLDKKLSEPRTSSAFKLAKDWLEQARLDLDKTAKGIPDLSELMPSIQSQIRNLSPEIINADSPDAMPTYRRGMNILIGGNRLGRGVTIPGLTVTYYGRDAKQKMMDTVHQHARMFGYRAHLLNVTRFFTSADILSTFQVIHEADEGMREQIDSAGGATLNLTPVWVGKGLKATRSNVLSPADIGAFSPGRQVFPAEVFFKAADVRRHVQKLETMLTAFSDDEEYREVSIDLLIEVIKEIPTPPWDSYSWRNDRVIEALRALESDRLNIKTGRLNVRRGKTGQGLDLSRPAAWPANGYADSGWVDTAKRDFSGVPTLLVLKQKGLKTKGWDNQPFYIPVLIMPKIKYAITFNLT